VGSRGRGRPPLRWWGSGGLQASRGGGARQPGSSVRVRRARAAAGTALPPRLLLLLPRRCRPATRRLSAAGPRDLRSAARPLLTVAGIRGSPSRSVHAGSSQSAGSGRSRQQAPPGPPRALGHAQAGGRVHVPDERAAGPWPPAPPPRPRPPRGRLRRRCLPAQMRGCGGLPEDRDRTWRAWR